MGDAESRGLTLYSKWSVMYDSSISSVPDAFVAGQLGIGAEITSPKLTFCIESLETVSRVLEAIVDRFEPRANETTSLHVNIGNGDKGFLLRTVKRVHQLWAVFDGAICYMINPRRIDSPFCKQSPGKGMTVPDYIEALDQAAATSPERLSRMVNPGNKWLGPECYRQYAINSRVLLAPGSGLYSKPVLEFVQHQGTISGQAVTNWVKFCAGTLLRSQHIGASFH